MMEDLQFCYLLVIGGLLYYTHWGMIMFDDCFCFTLYSYWRASRSLSLSWTFLPYRSGETLILEMC